MKEFDRNRRVVALGLTELQKLFAERYIEHFNGSRAVRESGSKASQPSVVAKEWPNNQTRPSGELRKHIGCRTEPVTERVATTVRTILSDVTTVWSSPHGGCNGGQIQDIKSPKGENR
jgi:hypothetical protein